MKQRTSWARRMRALTAAAWASAGLANSASATISFLPNAPDSTLRVTHTADLSIGAAGTSFKDVIPVADSGNIYPTNKYYQYGSKTLTYTTSGNTATSAASGSAGAIANSADLGWTLSSGTGVSQDDPTGKVYKGFSSLKFDFKGTFQVTSGTYGPVYGYLAFTPAVTVGSGGSAQIRLNVQWQDTGGTNLRTPVSQTLSYTSSSTVPFSSSQQIVGGGGGTTFGTGDKFIVKGSIQFLAQDPCGPTTVAPGDLEFSSTPPIWKFNPPQGSSSLDFNTGGNWINVMGASNEPTPTPNKLGARAQFVGTSAPLGPILITQPTTFGMLDIDQPGVSIQSLGPALTFDTFGSDAVLSTGALHDSSSTTHSINAPIVLNKPLEATTDSAGAVVLSGAVSGAGGITKSGAGVMVLSNASNSYGGNTTINQGAISVTGALPAASGVAVNSGGVLAGTGNGTTTGRVGNVSLTGGSIHPGASPNDGSIGTLTASGLGILNGDLRMDIANISSYDRINVQGQAVINGPTTITPVFNPLTIAPGTYNLLTAGGLNIQPGMVPAVSGVPTTSRLTFTLNAGPNNLSLVVGGANPKTLRWTGNGGSNWDLNFTTNWLDSAITPQTYYDLDNLTFDDTASNPNVFLNTVASPTNITVNNSLLNYSIFGNAASQIVGSTGLTKQGTGMLLLGVASSYTGVTAVQDGILQLGSPFALSSNSTLTLGSGGTSGTLDLNGNSATVGGLTTSGGGSSNTITNSAPASAVLTYAGQTGASTFGGTIQDGSAPVALHVASGMLILTGANTYTGPTTIDFAPPTDASDGVATLQIGNGGTSGNLGTGFVTNNGALVFNRADAFVVNNDISGSGALYKIGPGTLTLNGTNSASGGLFVKGGTLIVSGDTSLGQVASASADYSPVTIDGGTLVLKGSITTQRPIYLGMSGGTLDTGSFGTHFGDIAGCGDFTKIGTGKISTSFVDAHTLTINGGSIMVPLQRDNVGNLSHVSNISIPSGSLDLGGNDMVLDYDNGGAADPNKTTLIKNLITAGFQGGDWMGSGITSARAAQMSDTFVAALGYAEASATGLSTFDGIATDGDMVLVRLTAAGDANLDGVVNALDFNALAANFGQSNATWVHGDFDYNTVVNSIDFDLLAFDFNQSLLDPPSPGSGLGSLIPEPASALLLALPLLMRVRNRRGCS